MTGRRLGRSPCCLAAALGPTGECAGTPSPSLRRHQRPAAQATGPTHGPYPLLHTLRLFSAQYRHYQACLNIFRLKPSEESREFAELITFVAQVSAWQRVPHAGTPPTAQGGSLHCSSGRDQEILCCAAVC